MFENRKVKAVVSVCEAEHNPLLMNTLPESLCMNKFLKKSLVNKSRQQLPVYYRINGAIYIANVRYIEKCRSFFGKNTVAYIMPQERSVDIDTELDLTMAELLIKQKRNNK